MPKHRQILPILFLAILTGCTGTWKPKWISRFRPGAEDRRSAETAEASQDAEPADQLTADADTESQAADADLAAVERQTRMIRDAQTALRAERIEEARRLYREVLNDTPDHPDAHHGLAMASDLDEDWGDAEYHYKQALRIRPRDAVLLSDIGYSYVLQNRYAEAARYLNQAIELQPNYERAHMNLALLDIRQGNRAAAEQRLVQRLGNSSKTAGILASLERQAFPGTSVAAAPAAAQETRQPASGMSLEQVQELARRERALAELQRGGQDSAERQPESWFPGNPRATGTPAATVSGNLQQPGPQPTPAFASQSAANPRDSSLDANGYSGSGSVNPGAESRSTFPATNVSPMAGYAGSVYPPPGFRAQNYSIQNEAGAGYQSGGQPESLDRPSGRLALQPQVGQADRGPLWSANAGESSGGIALTPPIPIRSSFAGTTDGAESYGQPAGFNRGLPDRMRVVESGGGTGNVSVSSGDWGLRPEGLSIGPGTLFPAVEPPRNFSPNQRAVTPASYAAAYPGGGVVPAWGSSQRSEADPAPREAFGQPPAEVRAGYPATWPPAVSIPGTFAQPAGQPGTPTAPAPTPQPVDRAMQSYRDQLQQIESQFNRQPPPATYNSSRQ